MQKNEVTGRNMACVYLIAMIIQVYLIEPDAISPIKVFLMSIAPVMIGFRFRGTSTAFFYSGLFFGLMVFCAILQSSIRISTLAYSLLFMLAFLLYYNLIYIYRVFSVDFFVQFLRAILIVFCVTLILQQICVLIGLRYMPLINLTNQHFLAIDKLPVWSIEPSHCARITGALFLAYLRCTEIKSGVKLILKDLFNEEHRLITISTLWLLLTMGSGTAFIVLFLLLSYFFNKKTGLYFLVAFTLLYFLAPLFDFKQLNRALAIIDASISGSSDLVIHADGSAAARVTPLLNTLFDTDFFDKSSWFGHGTFGEEFAKQYKYNQFSVKIAIVEQYGLLGLFASLVFVYKCIINKIISIETFFFILLLGMSLNNSAYIWGCLMIFTTVRYFQITSDEENSSLLLVWSESDTREGK